MANDPAKRKHLLSLQQREDIADPLGTKIANPDWMEKAQLWGSIEPLGGTEYNQAMQNKSRASLKINTLFFENINSSQSTNYRFQDLSDQRIYYIEYTRNAGQWHEQIDWYVREDTSDG